MSINAVKSSVILCSALLARSLGLILKFVHYWWGETNTSTNQCLTLNSKYLNNLFSSLKDFVCVCSENSYFVSLTLHTQNISLV